MSFPQGQFGGSRISSSDGGSESDFCASDHELVRQDPEMSFVHQDQHKGDLKSKARRQICGKKVLALSVALLAGTTGCGIYFATVAKNSQKQSVQGSTAGPTEAEEMSSQNQQQVGLDLSETVEVPKMELEDKLLLNPTPENQDEFLGESAKDQEDTEKAPEIVDEIASSVAANVEKKPFWKRVLGNKKSSGSWWPCSCRWVLRRVLLSFQCRCSG
jgi:hypothetical protein